MFAAQTSGMPSGTVSVEPSSAALHLGVALGDHHRVDGDGADVAALAPGDHAVHDVHRLL